MPTSHLSTLALVRTAVVYSAGNRNTLRTWRCAWETLLRLGIAVITSALLRSLPRKSSYCALLLCLDKVSALLFCPLEWFTWDNLELIRYLCNLSGQCARSRDFPTLQKSAHCTRDGACNTSGSFVTTTWSYALCSSASFLWYMPSEDLCGCSPYVSQVQYLIISCILCAQILVFSMATLDFAALWLNQYSYTKCGTYFCTIRPV